MRDFLQGGNPQREKGRSRLGPSRPHCWLGPSIDLSVPPQRVSAPKTALPVTIRWAPTIITALQDAHGGGRSTRMRDLKQNFIGGQWGPALSGRTFADTNPARR